MSDPQGPESADGTPAEAGASAAAPAPLPIGGLLWIPAVFLVLTTLIMFGRISQSVIVRGAPEWPSVPPAVAAIQFINFAVPLFLSIKFFQRRRYVPLLVIAWTLLSLVPMIGLGQSLPPRAMLLKFVIAALLVSYLSLSKRVKRTFLL